MPMVPIPAARVRASSWPKSCAGYPAGSGMPALGLSRLKQTCAVSSTRASITRWSAGVSPSAVMPKKRILPWRRRASRAGTT